MKITRSLVAALFIALSVTACNSSPTAPAPGEGVSNMSPLLGSGIGG